MRQVFLALATTGVAITLYGLYDFFASFATWPAELRPPIRAAIKAHQAGNVKQSEESYRR